MLFNKYCKIIMLILAIGLVGGSVGAMAEVKDKTAAKYRMPLEESKHEGTWLQWPHDYTYGEGHKSGLEPIWVEMTKALVKGEKVHLIVYNESEKKEVQAVLANENIDMKMVDFNVFPTDDVWVRDNGPIFVYDQKKNLTILNWGFNGWGNKTAYKKCAEIPKKVSEKLGYKRIDLKSVVLEGGSIELDGKGTCLATRSAIVNKNRNPKLSEKQIENSIKENYGVKRFIWLDGVVGEDITDFHIDGFAKFYNDKTLITLKEDDLSDWGVTDKDIDRLLEAKDTTGKTYKHIYLPLTKENVYLESGTDLGYKGSYINYYIANKVVLVPNYNDQNDAVANQLIQKLYPDRQVVGIDVRELYKDGGMIHCVTQQQPINLSK